MKHKLLLMRRASWLLWLMLALLPLRAWAAATMSLPTSAADSRVAVAAGGFEPAALHAEPSPCHQTSDDGHGQAPACQACDWCHAALGFPPRVEFSSPTVPPMAPEVRIERDTGRSPIDGLERPPRSRLA